MIEGRDMNVRWDVVVDRAASAVDYYKIPPPLPRAENYRPAGNIQIHLQWFGALASLSVERSLKLELPPPATIADVLAALKGRLGELFLARVLDKTGAKHRYCRLFVDGYPIEDLRTMIDAAANPIEIEIILLIAPEGG
jgi:hypothetical protein